MNTEELKYKIHTFGCKVNTYDTGLLQKRLNDSGYAQNDNEPRIHILNTCAVTAEATKEAARTIRRLKVKDPFCTVVVTGCAAQVDTGVFEDLPGADLVVANSHKGDLENLIKKHFRGELDQKVFRSNIFKKEDLEIGGGIESHHTRAFLKIQDGCNSFCTYCVIPFARGKSRSIPSIEIVKKINELHSLGSQEVVLTGVHIGDYEWGLENLIEEILLKTKVPRIRLTSLEPPELTERMLELYQDDRMCPHFHMSIQSACSKTLRNMKRQYDAIAVERALQAIDKHVTGAFVGMDVIVGFAGETDEDFNETYARLASLPWTRIHVFPYSERPGTRAAHMTDDVSPQEKKARSQKLRALSSDRYAEHALAQIGATKKVLGLKNTKGVSRGLSRDYWQVSLNQEVVEPGEFEVKIQGFDQYTASRMDGCLVGTII